MDGGREKSLEWTRAALEQLGDQIEYVAEKTLAHPGRAGERFAWALDMIQTHPRFGTPGRRVGTRERPVTGSPLILVYRIERARILILAVMHQRQVA